MHGLHGYPCRVQVVLFDTPLKHPPSRCQGEFFFLLLVGDVTKVIQEWNGSFWVTRSLRDLGLVYHLGHGGQKCPTPVEPPLPLVVIDINGVHSITAHECGCGTSRISKHIQLLRERWYPATISNPKTCATFGVLDHFHLLNVVGGLSTYDFIGSLERRTDASGVQRVPVRAIF